MNAFAVRTPIEAAVLVPVPSAVIVPPTSIGDVGSTLRKLRMKMFAATVVENVHVYVLGGLAASVESTT